MNKEKQRKIDRVVKIEVVDTYDTFKCICYLPDDIYY